MEYKEQLRQPEWFDKSMKIKIWDNHQCQKCDFNNKADSIKGKLVKARFIRPVNVIESLNTGDERFNITKNNNTYEIDFISEENKLLKSSISLDKNYPEQVLYKLSDFKNCIVYYQDEGKLKNRFITRSEGQPAQQINGILWLSGPSEELVYCRGISAHHTCHITGKLAWEYPDELLTTLCSNCHTELHKNQSIPIFDNNKNKVGEVNFDK